MPISVALFDHDVLAFDIARRTQTVTERIELLVMRSCLPEKSDARELRLLRARREWPRNRRAAEQRLRADS
jgi:hypothetical protein